MQETRGDWYFISLKSTPAREKLLSLRPSKSEMKIPKAHRRLNSQLLKSQTPALKVHKKSEGNQFKSLSPKGLSQLTSSTPVFKAQLKGVPFERSRQVLQVNKLINCYDRIPKRFRRQLDLLNKDVKARHDREMKDLKELIEGTRDSTQAKVKRKVVAFAVDS
mmetsp:Transcript_2007/g.4525  ORF Transcript_2007/g.4525 Transcript_2007/m.4525 type:complete len:163 (-) Transcript_2007:5746-6234(-)